MSQLQYKSTAECPYLQTTIMQRIYIYHSMAENQRGVWTFIAEGSNDATIIVVNPFSGTHALTNTWLAHTRFHSFTHS